MHVNLVQEHKAFLSLTSLFPSVHMHIWLGRKRLFGRLRSVFICACEQQDPGGSQIAGSITHTNSESSTLLSPYSEIRFWIPLALQPDQSADLQPPLQHTDEA